MGVRLLICVFLVCLFVWFVWFFVWFVCSFGLFVRLVCLVFFLVCLFVCFQMDKQQSLLEAMASMNAILRDENLGLKVRFNLF